MSWLISSLRLAVVDRLKARGDLLILGKQEGNTFAQFKWRYLGRRMK